MRNLCSAYLSLRQTLPLNSSCSNPQVSSNFNNLSLTTNTTTKQPGSVHIDGPKSEAASIQYVYSAYTINFKTFENCVPQITFLWMTAIKHITPKQTPSLEAVCPINTLRHHFHENCPIAKRRKQTKTYCAQRPVLVQYLLRTFPRISSAMTHYLAYNGAHQTPTLR